MSIPRWRISTQHRLEVVGAEEPGYAGIVALARLAMTRVSSQHFLLEQLEDGWMLEATHVTKDADGDWMLNHDELEELHDLLQRALGPTSDG